MVEESKRPDMLGENKCVTNYPGVAYLRDNGHKAVWEIYFIDTNLDLGTCLYIVKCTGKSRMIL